MLKNWLKLKQSIKLDICDIQSIRGQKSRFMNLRAVSKEGPFVIY